MSYEPRKAAQLIASLILKTGGQSLNVLKAVKLVYLADRESFKRFGFPILDEARMSMPHGPVNSSTYSHINGEVDLKECGWADYLEDRAGHMIALADKSISVDDLDELSEADLECVEAVWQKFGKMDQWQIRDWTHNPDNVPEWEDPNGTSNAIPLRRILKLVGVENSEQVLEITDAMKSVDAAFKAARLH